MQNFECVTVLAVAVEGVGLGLTELFEAIHEASAERCLHRLRTQHLGGVCAAQRVDELVVVEIHQLHDEQLRTVEAERHESRLGEQHVAAFDLVGVARLAMRAESAGMCYQVGVFVLGEDPRSCRRIDRGLPADLDTRPRALRGAAVPGPKALLTLARLMKVAVVRFAIGLQTAVAQQFVVAADLERRTARRWHDLDELPPLEAEGRGADPVLAHAQIVKMRDMRSTRQLHGTPFTLPSGVDLRVVDRDRRKLGLAR
jgi:hypothetical protein